MAGRRPREVRCIINVRSTPYSRDRSGVYSGCYVVEHRCLISTPALKGIWYDVSRYIKCVPNAVFGLIRYLLVHILIYQYNNIPR